MGVLGFHFKVPNFQGGYCGVDCFLVLSGFLMTRIISSSIANESFRLRDFYISRFWRLFPSVLFTILGCLMCSFLVHTPSVAFKVCKSALAAIFSGSNVYFYYVSGYFDAGADIKPLLHFWSLSLEEQFYLVWPPILVLFSSAFKSDRWRLFTAFTAAMCFTSVVLPMTSGQSLSEGFSFFLLPTRLFEFGAGALIHVLDRYQNIYSPTHQCLLISPQFQLKGGLKPKRRLFGCMEPVMTEIGACAGLLLVIGSYITLPAASPVHFGIPAVVGTVLLILTPTAKTNGALLGNGASRWLGRLAYSVYLVHWPIYVYSLYLCRAMRMELLENEIILLLMSLCLGLALHKFVESRFRLKRGARVPFASLATILTLTALAISVSLSGIKTSGWKFRDRTQRKSISKLYAVPREAMVYEVGSKELLGSGARSSKMAVVGKGLSKNIAHFGSNFSLAEFSTIVVGNSFASAMIKGFYKAHEAGDRPFLFNFRPGCPFRPREGKKLNAKSKKCRFVSESIWKNVAKMPAKSTVVIVNDWEASGFYRPPEINAATEASAIARDVRNLGHVPVVLGAAPGVENCGQFNGCMDLLFVLEYWGLASKDLQRRCDAMAKPRKDLLRGEASMRKAVDAGEANFLYASSVQYLCGGRNSSGKLKCPSTVEVGGVRKGLYDRDGKHLSFYGAARHADLVRSTLKTVEKTGR